jgi:hypothetical protein
MLFSSMLALPSIILAIQVEQMPASQLNGASRPAFVAAFKMVVLSFINTSVVSPYKVIITLLPSAGAATGSAGDQTFSVATGADKYSM